MEFRAQEYVYEFPRPVLVMGILNVTPDSFTDGGQFVQPDAAVAQALKMAEQGADIIDIGGESSRPDAVPVSEAEELRRVLPVIEQLRERLTIPLSIDTQKSQVAKQALKAGASIINDIAANRLTDEMWRLAAETGAGYIAMHMQGTPQTMQINPTYADVVREIEDFFDDRMGRITAVGVREEQVVLDVGIGFGKTVDHNLTLLALLSRYKKYGRPLLLGTSRKSFISRVLGVGLPDRLPGSLACACWAVAAGVNILRVHDVSETVNAVRMTEAIMAHQQA